MKNYTEMTRDEISKITNRGGDDKIKLDRIVSDYLHGLDLSDKAQNVIANTEISAMAEIFGGLFTEKDVEDYIAEYYD